VSVLICTWNRADHLRDTLASLAQSVVPASVAWEVLVVDNNSGDHTPNVVRTAARAYPVPLRYLFEPRQGRSCAMNAGLAACRAPIVAFTDDDVRVAAEWLDAAVAPFRDDAAIDYTGGPVRPIWEAPPPAWFEASGRALWGTLAILDYGAEPFVFEERRLVPLGVNVAMRRSLIERAGGFDATLGRGASTGLMGQELPEFLARSRAIGGRGLYVPSMVVNHFVPSRRLRPDYWRRWWYGKGVSRARLEARHPVTELGLDLRRVPSFFGVPRFLFGNAARDARGWCAAALNGDTGRRIAHETQLCYFAGQLRARRPWRMPAIFPSRSLARRGLSGSR
jgi:glycosyltransferase involved in cell wall biosynthesis